MRLIDDTLFQSRMNLWDPESSNQNALLVEQQNNSAKKYSYIRVILFWCLIFITLFLLSTLMTVIYGHIRYGELDNELHNYTETRLAEFKNKTKVIFEIDFSYSQLSTGMVIFEFESSVLTKGLLL